PRRPVRLRRDRRQGLKEPAMSSQIGFIGLGRMGLPMAENLVRAGFRVVGFDMSEAARAAFLEKGGEVGGTVAEVAGEADLLVTMLPNGAIVRSALLDEPGFALG